VLIQAVELAAFLFGQNVVTAEWRQQTRRDGLTSPGSPHFTAIRPWSDAIPSCKVTDRRALAAQLGAAPEASTPEIRAGGALRFVMGATPNTHWATARGERPFSMSR
jgi:hypothetical protein